MYRNFPWHSVVWKYVCVLYFNRSPFKSRRPLRHVYLHKTKLTSKIHSLPSHTEELSDALIKMTEYSNNHQFFTTQHLDGIIGTMMVCNEMKRTVVVPTHLYPCSKMCKMSCSRLTAQHSVTLS